MGKGETIPTSVPSPFWMMPPNGHIKPKNYQIELTDLVNNLNGFWDFYHDINLGIGSPEALFMSMLLGKESNFWKAIDIIIILNIK